LERESVMSVAKPLQRAGSGDRRRVTLISRLRRTVARMPTLTHAHIAVRRLAAAFAAAVLIVLCLLGGTARAAGCSDSWIGGSGSWGDTSHWSTGAVPTSADDACITAAGTYTVTLTTLTDHYGNEDTANVAGLTLGATSGTQTLIVQGESSSVQGNWYNATTLNVGGDGLALGANGVLDLDATAATAAPTTGNEQPGGSANLGVDSGGSTPAPLTNAGTIIAQSSDSAFNEAIGVGGTLTNSGTIDAESGTLTLQGQGNLPFVTDNANTFSVASGATVTMIQGDGSSFTNAGTYANNGTTSLQQTMGWNQSGGTESGNPVTFTGQETFADTAGAGSFDFQNCGGTGGILTGTIQSNQSISVVGNTGCTFSTLTLGTGSNPPAVVNDGTLVLDAQGSGTSTGGGADLQGAELDNHATVNSTVTDTSYVNALSTALVNEAGASVNVTGTLNQTAGTPTTNDGTVNLAPGSLWLVQGGSFTNAGTLAPQLASATSFGQLNLTVSSKFNAGGTLAPSLAGGYAPAAGTEFQEVEMNGGGVSGTFASVTNGFSADYAKETASPPYLGIVYGSGSTAPASGSPSVSKVSGGAGKITLKLSCPPNAGSCARYSVVATITEHLKGKKLLAVTAGAKAKKKATKVVTVGSMAGTIAPGKSATVTLKLNGAGSAMLKRFHKLTLRVVISAGGKAISTTTVTVTKAKKKKKQK
jgi:hypothetical protein